MTQRLKSLRESLVQKEKTIVDDVEESFDVFSELASEASTIKNFLKKFKIGYKVKSFKQEKGATKKLRSILQNYLDADFMPEGGVGDLRQRIKSEVQEYEDGKANLTDAQIERVARTELSAMREAGKLVRWKEQGFKKVRHNTHIGSNTGEKDKLFNGRIFDIDYLLKHDEDRIPLHPSCHCAYTLYK